MTANSPILEIKREINLAQLWLPKPDVCDIDESRMTAHLGWRNPYNDAVIDVVVENADDGPISKWIIYGWPLSIVGNSHKTSGESTCNLARRLARRWNDARSDLMGVLDDIAREHGGDYQRLGL